MPKVNREVEREIAVKEMTALVADVIRRLPLGTVCTISDIVGGEMEARGYEFRHMGIETGYAWTKDGGKTFYLEEDDQFEILNTVQEELKEERKMDYSANAGQFLGLPYNLEFEILPAGEWLIKLIVSDSRNSRTGTVLVLDRDKDNANIKETGLFPEGNSVSTVTLSKRDLERIRELLADPLLHEEQGEFTPDEDVLVSDGDNLTVCFPDGRVFQYYALGTYEGILEHDPQSKRMLELVTLIRNATHCDKER